MEFPHDVSKDGVNIFFSNGVGLQVKNSDSTLRFMVMVPQELRGTVNGLLGNFNGDTTDDLRLPDGTTIPSDSSMETIHDEFGEACKCDGIIRFYDDHTPLVQVTAFR